jgi:hypothetical protein
MFVEIIMIVLSIVVLIQATVIHTLSKTIKIITDGKDNRTV